MWMWSQATSHSFWIALHVRRGGGWGEAAALRGGAAQLARLVGWLAGKRGCACLPCWLCPRILAACQ